MCWMGPLSGAYFCLRRAWPLEELHWASGRNVKHLARNPRSSEPHQFVIDHGLIHGMPNLLGVEPGGG